jgi:Fe-S oxidoreductase
VALEDYRADMLRCTRCSYCKWIPFDQVKSQRFAKGCPSIEYNRFQPYSAGGRLAAALSLLEGRSSYTERFVDITYNCLLCGLCDVACKVCRYNMEPLQAMRELRFKLVDDGQVLPQHMAMIKGLRQEGNMMMSPEVGRSDWAEGLGVKNLTQEKAEVVFHAGCRLCYDRKLQKLTRAVASLLKKTGVNFGIMGKNETCCGGHAFDMGYHEEFVKCAENNMKDWSHAGVKTVVTSCSDCYYAFKRLYPELGSGFEVVHMVEFVDRHIKQGKMEFTKTIPLKVTYHDPCHLGRQGEPYVPWKGREKKIRGQIVVYEPRRPRYNGALGVYEPPRDVLKAIPGLELVEMERIRESAWCCGAGGGVIDAYPNFSSWTAGERIEEAKSTGAEAIVSACPWCERNFIDTIEATGGEMKVYDVIELVQQAI